MASSSHGEDGESISKIRIRVQGKACNAAMGPEPIFEWDPVNAATTNRRGSQGLSRTGI
jgi:hypothetical protein